MPALIPVALIALVAVGAWSSGPAASPAWHLLIAVVLGVILSGTVLGPDISNVLSQLSGGHLH